MINIFFFLAAKYNFEAYSLTTTFLLCQLSIALFTKRLNRRRYWWGRIILATVVCVAMCILMAVWNTDAHSLLVRVICYSIINSMNLLFLLFCYDESASELLLTFCSGVAAYQTASKLPSLIQNLLGINDRATPSFFNHLGSDIKFWELLLFYALQIFLIFLLARIFARDKKLTSSKKTARRIASMTALVIGMVTILICISRTFEGESMHLSIITKIYVVIFGLIVLFAANRILSENESEQQLLIMEQIMHQEKRQFENVKANMDVINMKCHDLKKILGRIEGKLDAEETESLSEAIEFYDSTIRTGNEVLDVVLCEKAMTCKKLGITFSCMADGSSLDFLTPVQIYSVFGNIIDNAMEAVSKLEDPDKKVISLIIRQADNKIRIEESNYYNGNLNLLEGTVETTKQDASRHGYGIRSIRYIVKQYGGEVELQPQEDMFFLAIRFPLDKLKSCQAEVARSEA